jgi:5-methylthioadenosine/S-adenosylhomocysteine deaminase
MPKLPADLLIDGAWLITGNGAAAIERGAVVIADGRVLDTGNADAMAVRYQPVEQRSLPDHLLAPGLINSHGHLAMNLFRGSAEDLPLQIWLTDHIWPLEAKHVDADFVRDGAKLAMLEMLRAGITCFSDMYFYPETVAAEAASAGLRAQLAFPVLDMANAWSRNAEDAIHKGLALADRYRHDEKLQIAFGPHSVGTVNREALTRVLMFSEELDLKIQIHLHENAAEVADNRQQLGVSGIEHLNRLGLLGPNLQAVHVIEISPAELDLLQDRNVHVVHCPTSNAKLASGTCPVSQMLDRGINVCLGTDSAASNNRLSIIAEAHLATLMAKLNRQDAAVLSASQALDMATINGARALGLDADLGSLEPGKWADLIAVDTRAPELQPLYDPIPALIHTAADSHVTHVWVAGECLLDAGKATRVDEDAILANAARWREQIHSA